MPARVDPREPVMSSSVIMTRFSMRLLNLGFTVNDRGYQSALIPPIVQDGMSVYQKRARQAHLLAAYRICGDKILRTSYMHGPKHVRDLDLDVEMPQRCCQELGRQLGQI